MGANATQGHQWVRSRRTTPADHRNLGPTSAASHRRAARSCRSGTPRSSNCSAGRPVPPRAPIFSPRVTMRCRQPAPITRSPYRPGITLAARHSRLPDCGHQQPVALRDSPACPRPCRRPRSRRACRAHSGGLLLNSVIHGRSATRALASGLGSAADRPRDAPAPSPSLLMVGAASRWAVLVAITYTPPLPRPAPAYTALRPALPRPGFSTNTWSPLPRCLDARPPGESCSMVIVKKAWWARFPPSRAPCRSSRACPP